MARASTKDKDETSTVGRGRTLPREGRKRVIATHPDSAADPRFRTMADCAPVMIWMSGLDKQCTFFNEGWLRYTGRSMDQELGDGWAEGLHPDDFERSIETYSTSFDERRPFRMEYRLRRHDGAYRWLLDTGAPVYEPSGEFAGYIGSCVDIHEQKETEAELRAANAAKDEFLGLVSHELRTPIATIFGNARVLVAREDIDAESRRDALKDIARESARLERIIENMLALAGVGKRGAVELEPVRIGRIAEKQVRIHRETVPERDVILDVAPDLPVALAEPTYVEQVLQNLLSNAEKYGDPGAPVEVRVRAEDGAIIVQVLDRGPGIDPSEVDRIFSPFFRSSAVPRTSGGTGIGLAVCKRLIEAQGGTIAALPREGGGTEMRFTLPVV